MERNQLNVKEQFNNIKQFLLANSKGLKLTGVISLLLFMYVLSAIIGGVLERFLILGTGDVLELVGMIVVGRYFLFADKRTEAIDLLKKWFNEIVS